MGNTLLQEVCKVRSKQVTLACASEFSYLASPVLWLAFTLAVLSCIGCSAPRNHSIRKAVDAAEGPKDTLGAVSLAPTWCSTGREFLALVAERNNRYCGHTGTAYYVAEYYTEGASWALRIHAAKQTEVNRLELAEVIGEHYRQSDWDIAEAVQLPRFVAFEKWKDAQGVTKTEAWEFGRDHFGK